MNWESTLNKLTFKKRYLKMNNLIIKMLKKQNELNLSASHKRTVEKTISDLKKFKEIKAIYLFGSYAKGTAKPLSDVDLAFLIEGNEKKIETEVGTSSSPLIDAVPFHRLPLYIQFEVFKYGKELFVRDKKYLLKNKLQVLREYLDNTYWYHRRRKWK